MMKINERYITKLNEGKTLYIFNIDFAKAINEIVEVNIEEKDGFYAVSKKPEYKGSARLEFGKYEKVDMFDEVEERFIDATITITTESEDMAMDILEALEKEMGVEMLWCPSVDETKNGKVKFYDGFVMDYNHGQASSDKEDMMWAFKQAKKKIGIR